ncbi:UDP-glucose 4-epimerase [Rhodovastum atsumiense]|uniref:NAD-dependent epimerase/dehydratase family protein n=1 Tax=Rhodovastum atsumiense TaxID=504468 RepID=A0A5M6ISC0_9PROT|nr:NAD-dependent epimerase/dehydratase family protein [Rhodovastum atsumiense]KAA5610787.1 NAD-dependent epimerase/dehydratase family protein [Rhodovastum atsumiense]CAH2604458.1 UDP-glucose 4-epimerase [Rhodovastum atsumiense]
MHWRGRKVLVTGGAGFLGSNLCHALATQGARVVALDGFLFGGGANPANLEGAEVELVRADIRDVDLRPLCEGAEVIFNLAAQTSHMGGQRDPLADIAVNAVAQVRLIQAAREAAPDAVVVHASTRQFYGRAHHLPVDEEHPVNPPDANGVSKFAGEQYWMIEHRVNGRPVVSLRLTNCYGPRLRIRDARQTFLGIWIRSVLEDRPFEVWGGEQLRDMTYVDDVTNAFLLAGATPACHGRIFNIGGSPPASLKEIADITVRVAGAGARYTIREFPADRARIDIGSYHADDRAFRQATGWTPEVGLEDGIRRSLDWFRPRLAAYL